MIRLSVLLFLVMCSAHTRTQTNPVLIGYATYYAKFFEGRETYSGETFRQNKLTAASNHFPIGSILRVTNLENGKSVIVRINDRMHPRMAKKKHIVDLTVYGAKLIGFYGKFIVRCRAERLDDDKRLALK